MDYPLTSRYTPRGLYVTLERIMKERVIRICYLFSRGSCLYEGLTSESSREIHFLNPFGFDRILFPLTSSHHPSSVDTTGWT